MGIEELCHKLKIDSGRVINCYQFGSRVYGTNSVDSDHDFIIIYDNSENAIFRLNVNPSDSELINDKCDGVWSEDQKYQTSLYSPEYFLSGIKQHKIHILECLFLPEHLKVSQTIDYSELFKLNTELLWRSISASCHNSWDKCRKKLAVGEDYIALKSLFHSIRMGKYAIQIFQTGKIYYYHRIDDNYTTKQLWDEVMSFNNWKDIKEKYSPIVETVRNDLKSYVI